MDKTAEREKAKYEKVWERDEYRKRSFTVEALENKDLGLWGYVANATRIIDIGCGTGEALELIYQGYPEKELTGFDIAANCLDDGEPNFKFHEGCVWDWEIFPVKKYDFFLCGDMMEHIPTERVRETLLNIADVVKGHGYFGICLVPDMFGPILIGEPLHLTVKPAEWWTEQLEDVGFEIVKTEATPSRLHAIVGKGAI